MVLSEINNLLHISTLLRPRATSSSILFSDLVNNLSPPFRLRGSLTALLSPSWTHPQESSPIPTHPKVTPSSKGKTIHTRETVKEQSLLLTCAAAQGNRYTLPCGQITFISGKARLSFQPGIKLFVSSPQA